MSPTAEQASSVVVAGSGFPSLDPERAVLEPAGIEVIDANTLARDDVIERFREASGIMIDYFPCDEKLIAQLGRCRVICQYGVGLDQIDVDAATRAGIVVTYTPSYCIDELADHTLALLLAVARRIVRYDRLVRSGRWDYKDGMPIRRLSGRTLGLIGFGRVAQGVARRASGFGLRVIASDPLVPYERFVELGVDQTELGTLLETSDVVSLHVPLTPSTRQLLGAEELARLRDGAILVNTARGAVVDQAALVRELESGRLAGAGLDVLEEEPPSAAAPLLALEDAVLTPHAGFLSVESLERVQREAAEEVARVLAGTETLYGVNVQAALEARGQTMTAGQDTGRA